MHATNPNYGKGELKLTTAELLEADSGELLMRLMETFSAPDYQPPMLPRVALEVSQLANMPDTDFRRVAGALARDPILSGKVMAIANSPVYARGLPIDTLDDAVARLGIAGLRNIVMQVALSMRVFRAKSYSDCMESVRSHSVATAHIAHAIARRCNVDPNKAFLAGLLHDVGIAASLLVIVDALGRRSPPPLARFWASIQGCHDEAGQILCSVWGLPKPLRQAVARHHDPREGGGVNGVNPLGAVICLAEHFAHLHKRTVDVQGLRPGARVDRSDPKLLAAARDGLRIDRDDLHSVHDEAGTLIELLG